MKCQELCLSNRDGFAHCASGESQVGGTDVGIQSMQGNQRIQRSPSQIADCSVASLLCHLQYPCTQASIQPHGYSGNSRITSSPTECKQQDATQLPWTDTMFPCPIRASQKKHTGETCHHSVQDGIHICLKATLLHAAHSTYGSSGKQQRLA